MPAKIGKVDMDGGNPMVLKDNITRPEAITIDLDEKLIYFSTQYPSKVGLELTSSFLLSIFEAIKFTYNQTLSVSKKRTGAEL